MFNKEIEIFVHEKDVTSIYKHLQELLPAWTWASISIGWCGWANAMDCWWMRFHVSLKQKKELIMWIKENNIELYNPMMIP